MKAGRPGYEAPEAAAILQVLTGVWGARGSTVIQHRLSLRVTVLSTLSCVCGPFGHLPSKQVSMSVLCTVFGFHPPVADLWLGACRRLSDAVRSIFPYSDYSVADLHPFSYLRFYSFIFGEGKGGRKRGRETPMCGCLSRAPYWGPGLNPGLCSDWELYP